MRKIVGLTAAALTLAAAQAATAADLGARVWPAREPVHKASPVMMAAYNWSGFYIGGNVGYSWGKAETDVTPGFSRRFHRRRGDSREIPGSAFSESLKPSGGLAAANRMEFQFGIGCSA